MHPACFKYRTIGYVYMLKNHITISLKCFTLTVVYLIKLFNVNWLIKHIEWHFLWIDKQDYFLGIVNNTEKHQIWTIYLNGRSAWIGAVIRNIIRLISGGCQAWQPTNVSMWSKSFGITNGIPKILGWSVNLLHWRWLKIKKNCKWIERFEQWLFFGLK